MAELDSRKKSILIRITCWLFLLTLCQYLISTQLFPLAGAPLPRDFYQLYEPKRDLEESLERVARRLREDQLLERINFFSSSKTVDPNYIQDLLIYHRVVLRLFEQSRNKYFWQAFEHMGMQVSDILRKTGDATCATKPEYGNPEEMKEKLGPLLEELQSREKVVRDYDRKILSLRPSGNVPLGEFDVELEIKKVELLAELGSNPELFVNTHKDNPFKIFNEAGIYYDTMHGVYRSCVSQYNSAVKTQDMIKDWASLIVFIAISVLVWWRELEKETA